MKITITELLQQAYGILKQPTAEGEKGFTIESLLEKPAIVKNFKKIQSCLKDNFKIDTDFKQILIIVILFRKEDTTSDLDNIPNYLGLKSQLGLLSLGSSMQDLIHLSIVVSDNQGRTSHMRRIKKLFYDHYLDSIFLTSLIENKPTELKKPVITSDLHFIRKVAVMFAKMSAESSEYCYRFCLRNLIVLLKTHQHLELVERLTNMFGMPEFGEENELDIITPAVNSLITIVILYSYLNSEDEINIVHKFEDALGVELSMLLVQQIEETKHPLISQNHIQIAPQNVKEKFSLVINIKHQIVNFFLSSLPVDSLFNNAKFLNIEPPIQDNKIELRYPHEVKVSMDLIEKILEQNSFGEKLTVFLHGDPGTGKTSYVKNLAARTGKVLITPRVVKSMWYGESQKNLELLFDEVDTITSKLDTPPIFFIDEADSLLGVRHQLNETNSDTHNELQCILLRRIENFKGILILASNFPVSSFDPAFDRRMDFIIEVKTSPDTLEQMLVSKLKEHQIPYTKNELLQLVNSNLSPAIIDLVFRKQKLYKLAGVDFNILNEISNRIKNIGNPIGFAKAS